MVEQERIELLNQKPEQAGTYVLYWMQQAQRTHYNHALETAVKEANRRDVPVVVCFALTDSFPEANERHYRFMLQGIRETAYELEQRGILFCLRIGNPSSVVAELAGDACIVVTDAGYLRVQKQWRRDLAKTLPCSFLQVETDVVVPVSVVSDKEEYAARTIRPKIHRHLATYLRKVPRTKPESSSLHLSIKSETTDPDDLLNRLSVDQSVPASDQFKGGRKSAKRWLNRFVSECLNRYDQERSNPSLDICSHLSPYLHFGQISPIEIALAVQNANAPDADKDAFLEELIVRRELSMNYVHYQSAYDRYDGIPDWAKRTLEKHSKDKRDYVYSMEAWESAKTHDPYWNAAQQEMVVTGKMHNYMRMYWGKKIIEWSRTPEEAFNTMVYLNNKYELDGRDPNSFTGIAWCFGKHDRPWTERDVLGTVRYMNANGLKRKFPIDRYVEKVSRLTQGDLFD